MSAFQIIFTPPTNKQKPKRDREAAAVYMAPFSAKAIVTFEDVPIGKTAKRQLRIINSSDNDIEVKVIKTLKAEYNVTMSWLSNTILAESELEMELVWTPQDIIACTETIQLSDNRNFRKDITIVFKSKSITAPKNTRKFPSIGRTLTLKSPSNAAKSKMQNNRKVARRSTAVTPKANVSNATMRKPWSNACTPRKSLLPASPKTRYANKENVSPRSPNYLLKVIDSLQFTPIGNTASKPKRLNLASAATPQTDYQRIKIPQLRLPNEFSDEEDVTSLTSGIYNKTFDMPKSSIQLSCAESTRNGNNKLNSFPPEIFPSTKCSPCSDTSIVSHTDLLFNQNEILAQSSRLNLNELGLKSRKNSPIMMPLTTPAEDQKLKNICESGRKRQSRDTSFVRSLSNLSMQSTHNPLILPKRQRLDKSIDLSCSKNRPAYASTSNLHSWSRTQPKMFKLPQKLAFPEKKVSPKTAREAPPRVKLYDSELYLNLCINPDPFAATTTVDPFLASTMYLDEVAVERHQTDIKKWLNALVTAPADLDTDSSAKIDVAKLFNEARNKELTLAPTKEEQSMNYLTLSRLETLRRAAIELYLSDEMYIPCSKVAVHINKGSLRIRDDRNLNLDVVTQRNVLELLLCFNPLWLRIGLEVVYAEKLHLHSNRDVVGLSTFILNRLLRDKPEEQKHSRAHILSLEYIAHIKRFTLQKFLSLLLFLDKAKNKRIIKHNPCLFVKNSPYKETKEILLRFSSELLANIGDIARDLKRLGYVLTHKQAFIDEYNYAFTNLGVDLRDGVRLTRVMELILLRDDLTSHLRVPAISRLQRIHNVNVALSALKAADFNLRGDISAADIVDGYREKTLSLLWQIIYKFRSPKFLAAASVIQKWWRRCWLRVTIRRRIRHKEFLNRERAATVIQAYCRGHQTRIRVTIYKAELTAATIILQKYTRRYLAQKHLHEMYISCKRIQKWYHACRLMKKDRGRFLQMRQSAIILQRTWRRRTLARRLLATAEKLLLERYQRRDAAAAHIQEKWRAYCIGREVRNNFISLKSTIVWMQRRVRANRAMKAQCNAFQQQRRAAISMQRHYRAQKLMRTTRTHYLEFRMSVIIVQRRWRAVLQMRQAVKAYRQLQAVTIYVQRHMRAKWEMQRQKSCYEDQRRKIIFLQRKFRAHLLMKQQQNIFIKQRQAAIILQRAFRALCSMRHERENFERLRKSAICCQHRWRANKLMWEQRTVYNKYRAAIICIQQRYRAKLLGRQIRLDYTRTIAKIIRLQRFVRAVLEMRRTRKAYLSKVAAIVKLQRRVRTFLAMKRARHAYVTLQKAAIRIQLWYRGLRAMRQVRADYQYKCQLIISIQRKWRSKLLARQERALYLRQLNSVRFIQIRLRAIQQMRLQRNAYQELRSAAIVLQRRYRALVAMRCQKARYQQLRAFVVRLQAQIRFYMARQRYRALLTPEMIELLQRKKAAKVIQRYWRGYRIRKHTQCIDILILRRRVQELKKHSKPTDSVRFKVTEAVRFLRGRFVASEALAMLHRLDRLTRTVPHLVSSSSQFISTFCYGMMAQAIRSEIDKQMIECCSRIILNLARYDSDSTFQEGGLVTIAQILLRWCDKDCDIFNTLCTLVWIFAHCSRKREIIRKFMITTEAIYMLRETKRNVARKQKMIQNARRQPKTLIHAKQRMFAPNSLPGIEPDFGLIHSTPYIFISSEFAFDIMLKQLEINVLSI